MRTKLIVLLLIGIFLTIPTINIGHALYTVNLPSNILYADDFENYTSTNCTGNTSTSDGTDQGVLTTCLPGWAYLDNNCGSTGTRAINNTYAFTPIHSLSLQMNKVSAKCDIDRRNALMNTTSIIQLSIWFTFTNTMLSTNNIAGTGDDFHISLEYWDTTTHWEAVIFYKAKATGAQPDLVDNGTPGVTQGTDNLVTPILKPFDLPSDNRLGYWHYEKVSMNVRTHQWVSAEIDGISYTYIVGGHNLRSIADSSWVQNFPTTQAHSRVEFSVEGNVAFTASTDRFWVFFDDLQLSDISTSSPPPIIQFTVLNSLISFLALLGIAMILLILRPSLNWLSLKPARRGITRGGSGREGPYFTAEEIKKQHKQSFKIIVIILFITFLVSAFAFLYGSYG